MPVQNHQEFRSSLEAMLRGRGVESPPDPKGLRKVWHRGAGGAELVTLIDGAGRVLQHEFSLGDAALRWETGNGFHGDQKPNPLLVEALRAYSGRDRILHHFREVTAATVLVPHRSQFPKARPAWRPAVNTARSILLSRWGKWWLGAGVLVFAVALAVFLLK